MLANSQHSRLILINPARKEPGDTSSEFLVRRRESLSLLANVLEVLDLTIDVAGEYQADHMPAGLSQFTNIIDRDALSVWHDPRFTQSVVAKDVTTIFFGGAWLEEDVLIAAMEGVKFGYDVRVLVDLSVARSEPDRSLVFHRLTLHGVLAVTLRQTMLEWAVCLQDPDLKQQIRQLLA